MESSESSLIFLPNLADTERLSLAIITNGTKALNGQMELTAQRLVREKPAFLLTFAPLNDEGCNYNSMIEFVTISTAKALFFR